MRNSPVIVLSRALCAAFLYSSAGANARAVTITNLGAFNPSAINQSGEIAGSISVGGVQHAAVFSESTGLTDLVSAGILGSPSAALAINDAGVVLGAGSNGPFLYDPGTGVTTFSPSLATLQPPALNSSIGLTGINNAGQITGSYNVSGSPGAQATYLYTPGQGTISLGTLGDDTSTPSDINNAGQVVGTSAVPVGFDSFLIPQPYLYTPGIGLIDLGSPGQPGKAYAVNDLGQVVGGEGPGSLGFGPKLSHPFLYTPGVGTVDLGFGGLSVAVDINNFSEILVNTYPDFPDPARAFLYYGGVATDLNSLLPADSGWVLTRGLFLNDAGQIVGEGTFNGADTEFLLDIGSPVPEPATFLLIGFGIAAIRLKRRLQ